MEYEYVFRLHPRLLPVTVYVGTDSEFGLPYPHLWTGKDQAEVWYPPDSIPVEVTSIPHEGVHLAAWGLEVLPHASLRAMIPRNDMCWGYGKKAVREEAMARMVDRHVANFYYHANRHGLDIIMPKTTNKIHIVDDADYYALKERDNDY